MASGAYVWHRVHLSQSGNLPVPWVGAPNNVVTIGEVSDGALAGATLKRVVFEAWAHVTVDPASDGVLPDWQSRVNWFFTIGHSFAGGDPAPDPDNFGESVTIGSGQLVSTAQNVWNATDLIWLKSETPEVFNFESQRAAPNPTDVPRIQVGTQSSAYDTLADPLTGAVGTWSFDCWIRALYQSL